MQSHAIFYENASAEYQNSEYVLFNKRIRDSRSKIFWKGYSYFPKTTARFKIWYRKLESYHAFYKM